MSQTTADEMLPSQLTGFVNLTASHLAVLIAGGLITIGAVQPSAQGAAVPIIAGIIAWVAGQGYAYIIQHMRHQTAVSAVNAAASNVVSIKQPGA